MTSPLVSLIERYFTGLSPISRQELYDALDQRGWVENIDHLHYLSLHENDPLACFTMPNKSIKNGFCYLWTVTNPVSGGYHIPFLDVAAEELCDLTEWIDCFARVEYPLVICFVVPAEIEDRAVTLLNDRFAVKRILHDYRMTDTPDASSKLVARKDGADFFTAFRGKTKLFSLAVDERRLPGGHGFVSFDERVDGVTVYDPSACEDDFVQAIRQIARFYRMKGYVVKNIAVQENTPLGNEDIWEKAGMRRYKSFITARNLAFRSMSKEETLALWKNL